MDSRSRQITPYLEPEIIHFEDSGSEIGGIRFWGSPRQPWFHGWGFNLPRKGAESRKKWNLIPIDTDVLTTEPEAEPEDVPVTSTAWDDGPFQTDVLETEPAVSGSISIPGGSLPELFQNLKKGL